MDPVNKRIFGIVAILAVIVFVIFAIVSNRQKPSYTESVIDKDTGETLYTDPNKTPEQYGLNKEPILLGTSVLFDNGVTQAQFAKAREALNTYSSKNLHNKYPLLKILPAYVQANTGIITTKLRLGDTDQLVDISFKFANLETIQIIIDDPSGKQGGNYDSGTLVVTPDDPLVEEHEEDEQNP